MATDVSTALFELDWRQADKITLASDDAGTRITAIALRVTQTTEETVSPIEGTAPLFVYAEGA